MYCSLLIILLAVGSNAQLGNGRGRGNGRGDQGFDFYSFWTNNFYGGPFGGFDYDWFYGQTSWNVNRYTFELEGGLTPNEGRVIAIERGNRGTICDYGWNKPEADAICKQLGYRLGGVEILHSGFGPSTHEMYVSYANCRSDEQNLNDCELAGMSISDRRFCNREHEAGVRCFVNQTETDYKPSIKLVDTDSYKAGKVMVLNETGQYNPICAEGWSVKEAIVVCREMNAKWYAKRAYMKTSTEAYDVLDTIKCRSEEESVANCTKYPVEECTTHAAVECSEFAPDLLLDLTVLQNSVALRNVRVGQIKCAIEERCVSESTMNSTNNPYSLRQMLKFSALVWNEGTADFRPPGDPNNWEYHECHRHFHSIAEFAYYDVVSADGSRKVKSGHKASYCLRDSRCRTDLGVRAKYYCDQYRRNGDTQGISVHCADLYGDELDCQWVDISDIPSGEYFLEIRLNPHKLVAETSYDNNFYRCPFTFYRTHMGVSVIPHRCTVGAQPGQNPMADIGKPGDRLRFTGP